MLRIAVCDDERSAIATIRGYLNELKKEHYPEIFFDSFTSGEDLLEHYQRTGMEEYYDIIFMDVEMGCINGLSTVTEIKKIDENPLVIYITNHSEFVYDSFETAPFNYLLKPVSFEDFTKVFRKAVLKKEGKNNTFTFMYNHEETRIYLEEVYYFESKLYKVSISTAKGDYSFSGALRDVCKALQNKGFALSHNSFLINLAHIFKLRYNAAVLQNGVEIPVSPSRSKELKEAYAAFKYRRSGL